MAMLLLECLIILRVLTISAAAISNYAAHIVAVLRLINFEVEKVTRSNVERVVAKINGNKRWRGQIKCNERAMLCKLIQYAKCGTCERGAPVTPEVNWIKLSKSPKDSRPPSSTCYCCFFFSMIFSPFKCSSIK